MSDKLKAWGMFALRVFAAFIAVRTLTIAEPVIADLFIAAALVASWNVGKAVDAVNQTVAQNRGFFEVSDAELVRVSALVTAQQQEIDDLRRKLVELEFR